MRSVVKHSYIRGTKGKERALAHVKYISYRGGDEKEKTHGARSFFDDKREKIAGAEVRNVILEQDGRRVIIHKLILSPGVNGVNMEDYTREVMQELGRSKGLDLEYYGTVHRNTDHDHAHVVIMGQDKHGRNVRFDGRDDYKLLRDAGDRYLEKYHSLDRYLDRDLERLLAGKYDRTRGDDLYERLFADLKNKESGDDYERAYQKIGEAERQHQFFDDELRRTLGTTDLRRPKGFNQIILEGKGRLLESHERYTITVLEKQLKDELKLLDEQADADPKKREEILEQLEWYQDLKREEATEAQKGPGQPKPQQEGNKVNSEKGRVKKSDEEQERDQDEERKPKPAASKTDKEKESQEHEPEQDKEPRQKDKADDAQEKAQDRQQADQRGTESDKQTNQALKEQAELDREKQDKEEQERLEQEEKDREQDERERQEDEQRESEDKARELEQELKDIKERLEQERERDLEEERRTQQNRTDREQEQRDKDERDREDRERLETEERDRLEQKRLEEEERQASALKARQESERQFAAQQELERMKQERANSPDRSPTGQSKLQEKIDQYEREIESGQTKSPSFQERSSLEEAQPALDLDSDIERNWSLDEKAQPRDLDIDEMLQAMDEPGVEGNNTPRADNQADINTLLFGGSDHALGAIERTPAEERIADWERDAFNPELIKEQNEHGLDDGERELSESQRADEMTQQQQMQQTVQQSVIQQSVQQAVNLQIQKTFFEPGKSMEQGKERDDTTEHGR